MRQQGKFDGIIICSDLDGTLLNERREVSEQNRAAVEYFMQNGGTFTFNTGRALATAAKQMEILRPNAPVGLINGAGVYDCDKKSFISHTELPKSSLEIAQYVEKNHKQIGIIVSGLEGVYFYSDNISLEAYREATRLPFKTRPFDSISEPITKIVFACHIEQKMLELIGTLSQISQIKEVSCVRSAKELYEVLPIGVNKANALRKIVEILGGDIKRVIAVGDFNNDISMIKAAGLGIAVENGCDEIKKEADLITVKNTENAIAKIISDLDAGKIKI